jgi:biotin synthase
MSDEMQAMTFFAGANSIFYGERLLTTANPQADKDRQLFQRLGIHPERRDVPVDDATHQAALQEAITEQKNSKLFYDASQASSLSDGAGRERKPCGLVV